MRLTMTWVGFLGTFYLGGMLEILPHWFLLLGLLGKWCVLTTLAMGWLAVSRLARAEGRRDLATVLRTRRAGVIAMFLAFWSASVSFFPTLNYVAEDRTPFHWWTLLLALLPPFALQLAIGLALYVTARRLEEPCD